MTNIGEVMEQATIQLEYDRMSLEMVTREWGFMYDVMKATFSSLLITIPIYLSIIGFLLSYLELKYRGWIIGLCSVILAMILLLVYYYYRSFVEMRLQLPEKFDIYKFLERASKQYESARERVKKVLMLYGLAHVVFITIILILNFAI